MERYRAEYMVGGTLTGPSKVIEIRMRAMGRFAQQIGSLIRNEAQKKHLSFVPRPIVAVAGAVSRVKMNATERRP